MNYFCRTCSTTKQAILSAPFQVGREEKLMCSECFHKVPENINRNKNNDVVFQGVDHILTVTQLQHETIQEQDEAVELLTSRRERGRK